MNRLNQVILEGEVSCSAEGEMPNGGFLLMFRVLHNSEHKDASGRRTSEQTSIDCEMWGEFAKKMSGKCKKGQNVRIVGRLAQKNRSDGEKGTSIYLLAEHVDFLPLAEKTEEKF